MTVQNNTTLLGRIGNDPSEDIKHLQGDKSVLELRLAVNRSYKDADGNYITDWIPVKFWNAQANTISEFFNKGDRILVGGELRVEFWENDEGEKRSKMFVQGNSFSFIEKSEGNGEKPKPKPKKKPKKKPEPEPEEDFDLGDDDDDLPPF